MAIPLSPGVFGNLYKDTLVLIDEKIHFSDGEKNNVPQVLQENEVSELLHSGDNRKHIIFILNAEKEDSIPSEWKETLQKLMHACKLSMKDVALIEYKGQPITESQLKMQLKPETVLLFGLDTLKIELPFSVPDYQIQPFDGCRFMTAPLETLSTDNSAQVKQQKQLLWGKLKELFLK